MAKKTTKAKATKATSAAKQVVPPEQEQGPDPRPEPVEAGPCSKCNGLGIIEEGIGLSFSVCPKCKGAGTRYFQEDQDQDLTIKNLEAAVVELAAEGFGDGPHISGLAGGGGAVAPPTGEEAAGEGNGPDMVGDNLRPELRPGEGEQEVEDRGLGTQDRDQVPAKAVG